MAFIHISDRGSLNAPCLGNPDKDIPDCDGKHCTHTYITINGGWMTGSSCSLYPNSLYYKFVALFTKYNLSIEKSTSLGSTDMVNIEKPVASLIIELDALVKEYS